LGIKAGQRMRLVTSSKSVMFHRMHLQTFAHANGGGRGLRKDTSNVVPMQRLAVHLQATIPANGRCTATTSITASSA